MPPRSAGTRWETLALVMLTLAGATLRLQNFGHLGLTHFDEGIYASAALWVYRPGGLSDYPPSAIAYAPPGYPILVGGLDFLTGGPSDVSALVVSLLSGILTIPLVGWLGRRIFGSGAGVTAAAFAAFSGPHVAFSRMALTDSTFLLAWLGAVALGIRFLERPSAGRACGLGVAVGLAQLLKYNGLLVGGIVALSAIPSWIRPGLDRRRGIGWGLLAVVLALGVDWPWVRFVEAHGGYARLLAHQRSYSGGPATWWPHARIQIAQMFALGGSPVGMAAAWTLGGLGGFLGVGRVAIFRGLSGPGRAARLLGLVSLAGLSAALPGVGWILGLAKIPSLIRDESPARRILGVWLLVLSLVTPLYHPYARLWLPLEAAGWLAVSGIVSAMLTTRIGRPSRWTMLGVGGVGLAILGVGLTVPSRILPGILAPTDELRRIVLKDLRPAIQETKPTRVLSLARPPLAFYIGGQIPLVTMPDLATLRAARRPGDGLLLDEGQIPLGVSLDRERSGEWGPATVYRFRPSLPTLLDEDPEAARRGEVRPIRLWWIAPR